MKKQITVKKKLHPKKHELMETKHRFNHFDTDTILDFLKLSHRIPQQFHFKEIIFEGSSIEVKIWLGSFRPSNKIYFAQIKSQSKFFAQMAQG